MTILFRWIPFVVIVLALITLGQQQALDGILSPIYLGLKDPLLNMCHLMFLMLGATVAFCVTRRPYEFILLLSGVAAGIWMQQVFGYVPGAKLLSGLSLVLLLLVLWLPGKLGRFMSPFALLAGMAHGIWSAADNVGDALSSHRLVFMLATVASYLVLGLAWGTTMKYLKDNSGEGYDGLEHLLVATVVGSALVYIYWGLFKQA
jgi:hypothetical protein